MTGLEYFVGLLLLLVGFNIGFYEAGKGMRAQDFKKLLQPLLQRIRR